MSFESSFIYGKVKFTTGDRIQCKINGVPIKDGKIYICSKEESDRMLEQHSARTKFAFIFYICQNQTDGQHTSFFCPDLLGYKSAHPAGILTVDEGLTDGVSGLTKTVQNQMLLVVEEAFAFKG